jgi:hypothetical protein
VARSIPTKLHTNNRPNFIKQISYSGIEQEENEVLMVEFPHTITHPRTVVIHPQNAPLAYGAVVNPLLLDHVTLETIQSHDEGVDLLSSE